MNAISIRTMVQRCVIYEPVPQSHGQICHWFIFQVLGVWMAPKESPIRLVIYGDGDNQRRALRVLDPERFRLAENMTVGADMTTHAFIRDYNNFLSNPFISKCPSPRITGRSACFRNIHCIHSLSADSLLVRTTEFNTRVPINAIQIIPRATASGATLDPVNASQTYAGGRGEFSCNGCWCCADDLPMAEERRTAV
jgi:hypothetical protein